MLVAFDATAPPGLNRGVETAEEGLGHQHILRRLDPILEQAVHDDDIFARHLLELADLAEGRLAPVDDCLEEQIADVLAGVAGAGSAILGQRQRQRLGAEGGEEAEYLGADIACHRRLVAADRRVEQGGVTLELVEDERVGGVLGHLLQKLGDHLMGMRQAVAVQPDEHGVSADFDDDQGHVPDVHVGSTSPILGGLHVLFRRGWRRLRTPAVSAGWLACPGP